MSKFDNKEFEESQIQKLMQEQLIKEILNRKNIDTQALIKATKENPNKTNKEIVKIKDDIVKLEINKQNEKNKKEINEKIQNIQEVEKQIEQNNKQKQIEKQKRAKLVEEIIEVILKKQDTTITEKKQDKLKKNKNELIDFLNKQKKKTKNKKNNKFKNLKQKISNFRLLKGINIYKKNMEYYFEENKIGSNFNQTVGTVQLVSFKDRKETFNKVLLQQKINHQKAYIDSQKKAKQQYEFRTH